MSFPGKNRNAPVATLATTVHNRSLITMEDLYDEYALNPFLFDLPFFSGH